MLNKKGGKVTIDYKREVRGILLVSLFIMVVPLIFFPKDFGLRFKSSIPLLFVLELGWYLAVLFAMFSKATPSKVFLLAMLTLGYRFCVGIGFALLLLVMFALPLSSSLRLGIYHYLPVFLLQTLMSPFALKSLFGVFIKRTQKPGKTEAKEVEFSKKSAETFPSDAAQESGEKSRHGKPISLEKETKMTKEDKLGSYLNYLREYSGVKAAILVDYEGLVVAEDSSSDFDPETVASFALCMKETNDQILRKMGERNSERIGIYTQDIWMCLNQIGDFTLVVLSDRKTDELLSVRILQSTGMIKKVLTKKYQGNMLKAAEA
jgi:predicted regulator of Ras-like GTPase activity (Roadblock/LC7/MglB family)